MAASAAFAVNVGLLQHDDTKPVGVLDTSAIESIDTTAPIDPTVVTVIVEDPPIQGAVASSAPATERAGTYSDDLDDDASEIERSDDDSPSVEPAEVEHDDDD